MKIIEHHLAIPPNYQYRALKKGNIFQRQWHKNRLILIEKILKLNKNDIVCDIGCGSGNVILSFFDKVKKFDGADYNNQCIHFIQQKIKKNKIKNIRMYLWNVLYPPKKGLINQYNKAVLNEVIEHFKPTEINKVLKNVKKVLKSNGELLITTPNCGISPWFLLEFAIDKFNLFPKLWGEQHKSRFDNKSLKAICEKNGFRILKIGTFSLFSLLGIIFGKKIADWLIKKEIDHLKFFGPQLFIYLKKQI